MPRIKEIILALAIVVVLNLFFNYGVFTFYKSPDYEKFCPVELNQERYENKEQCEAMDGRWFGGPGELDPRYYKYQAPALVPVSPEDSQAQKGWCDPTAKCRESYESSRNVYNRNVFVVLILAGLVSLALGFLIISASPVAHGFLGGGLISLIIGTIRYWSDMDDYLRFIILGVALAVLVWLGYKKISSE